MGTEPHRLTVLEHQDLVGVADAADPLGDDDHRGIAGVRRKRGAQAGVGGHVEGREGVVERVDIGAAHQSPGDCQALALAAGDVRAPLGNGGFEAAHGLHEVGRLCHLEGLPHLGFGGVGLAVAKVAGHGAAEQIGALGYEADALPHHIG